MTPGDIVLFRHNRSRQDPPRTKGERLRVVKVDGSWVWVVSEHSLTPTPDLMYVLARRESIHDLKHTRSWRRRWLDRNNPICAKCQHRWDIALDHCRFCGWPE